METAKNEDKERCKNTGYSLLYVEREWEWIEQNGWKHEKDSNGSTYSSSQQNETQKFLDC